MDPRNVKQDASAALAGANYDMKKLALLHSAAVVLFSLVTSLLSWLLRLGMDSAGGLSGIALRSMLGTAQSVLSLAGSFALPFWQIGFVYAALRCSRRESVASGDLLEGFRRFGPVLRLNLLLALVAMGVMMAGTYIATTIFMFSPFSDGLNEAAEALLASTDPAAITDEMIIELLPHMGWLPVLVGVVLIAIGLPMYYRYRMSEFALLCGAKGALAAMRESTWLSRGRRMAMFKFDLSFWWFYAAQLGMAAIAYIDVLLSSLGVTLPVSADVLYWILFAVHSVITLLFTRQYGAYYQTAYARYYDLLREVAPPMPGMPTQNNNLPG